jgi:pimeloyl-ACP methyl ester carboxylesterase
MRSAIWAAVMVAAMGAQRAAGPAAQTFEQHADLPGVRLFYIDTGGGGVPLVLMHPATSSVRAWEHQLPAFTKAGYRARIKRAESVVVPEAGHSTYWEQPGVFNRAVLNFIRKH